MYEFEIFEVTVEGVGAMYGIRCGDVYKLLSHDSDKVQRIIDKCNFYGGIDPIHLNDIIEDEMD